MIKIFSLDFSGDYRLIGGFVAGKIRDEEVQPFQRPRR